MKAFSASLFITSLVVGGAALAKDKPVDRNAQLKSALAAVAATVTPPGQANRKVDPDQGDDHANPRAILRVCSKDTPAAQRSAICPSGVSPD